MRPQDIITKKRDGERLSKEEIFSFIKGVTDESWADYQISALIMAMYLNELNSEEQSNITQAMLESGEVMDFSDIDKPIADKHSTGGVGDKTSLIIAPIAAACGLAVPMISGRGLGHTGGTLDKLESIEGFNVNLTTREFKEIVRVCGYAMAGQTSEIAPADKKIYALRDATATVSTIPLIVASIMSKKLAEGLEYLVLDVKTGNGAFMVELKDARKLSKAMVDTGNTCGVKTRALITDMNQPLGKYVGNSLEVYECVKVLRNEFDENIRPMVEVASELTAQLLLMSEISVSLEEARTQIQTSIENGKALEKFRQNVELQKGNPAICDNPETLLGKQLREIKIKARRPGFIREIQTTQIGSAICAIGGGRMKTGDGIDPEVGFSCLAKHGDEIKENEVLGILYCRNEQQENLISEKLQNAYKIADEKPDNLSLVKEIIQ